MLSLHIVPSVCKACANISKKNLNRAEAILKRLLTPVFRFFLDRLSGEIYQYGIILPQNLTLAIYTNDLSYEHSIANIVILYFLWV